MGCCMHYGGETMKMTRRQKRDRHIAKIVEMKLDGIQDVDGDFMKRPYEWLCEVHRNHKSGYDYYGKSITSFILDGAAQRMRRDIDKQLLQEALNGKTS